MRPTWTKYFLRVAEVISSRATCQRRKVGAVIVKDNRILATGYNGAPKGQKHCETCLRTKLGITSGDRLDICRGVHAEMNAILQAASAGISIRGGTLYCTTEPCLLCTKALINVGIIRFVVTELYVQGDLLASTMRAEAGIKMSVEVNKG